MANDTQAATYTNDPANNSIDLFRLRVGDTDCRDAYLTDAEVRFFLAEEATALHAAAAGAAAIAAKVARKVDFRHGPFSKPPWSLFDHYNALADSLLAEAMLCGVAPEVLGRTV